MARAVPGRGIAERSEKTRKLSVAFPIDHLDQVIEEAERRGVSASEIVREAVASWVEIK